MNYELKTPEHGWGNGTSITLNGKTIDHVTRVELEEGARTMSEATETPSLKTAIEEQAKLIMYLQKRLREAVVRNNAEDSHHFAEATHVATQTWIILVEA